MRWPTGASSTGRDPAASGGGGGAPGGRGSTGCDPPPRWRRGAAGGAPCPPVPPRPYGAREAGDAQPGGLDARVLPPGAPRCPAAGEDAGAGARLTGNGDSPDERERGEPSDCPGQAAPHPNGGRGTARRSPCSALSWSTVGAERCSPGGDQVGGAARGPQLRRREVGALSCSEPPGRSGRVAPWIIGPVGTPQALSVLPTSLREVFGAHATRSRQVDDHGTSTST